MQGRDKVLGEENIGHNLLKKMGEPFVLQCVWYYEARCVRPSQCPSHSACAAPGRQLPTSRREPCTT